VRLWRHSPLLAALAFFSTAYLTLELVQLLLRYAALIDALGWGAVVLVLMVGFVGGWREAGLNERARDGR
jgi:hypothetical protein